MTIFDVSTADIRHHNAQLLASLAVSLQYRQAVQTGSISDNITHKTTLHKMHTANIKRAALNTGFAFGSGRILWQVFCRIVRTGNPCSPKICPLNSCSVLLQVNASIHAIRYFTASLCVVRFHFYRATLLHSALATVFQSVATNACCMIQKVVLGTSQKLFCRHLKKGKLSELIIKHLLHNLIFLE